MSQRYNLLGLVDLCDNFLSTVQNVSVSEVLVPWVLKHTISQNHVIGLLRPSIVSLLRDESADNWDLSHVSDANRPYISFAPSIDSYAKRSAVLKELCERWRDQGKFADIIGPRKWRDELYSIYADPFGKHDYPAEDETLAEDANYVFRMERSACALFGVVTYGVHMTIYKETVDGDLDIWTPTRAKTKQTWPGYLDNSVAGGIPAGTGIFDSMVKECHEEASISEDIVRKHAKAVGAISYFFRTAAGWLQPEVEYVYDIKIPSDQDVALFQPRPLDGEVESFELLPRAKVLEYMSQGRFKPNTALVLIDLFIRLGFVTPDNEPDFMHILTRLHSRFGWDALVSNINL